MPEESAPGRGSPHTLRATAMLVCERIITDVRSGRVSLIDLLAEVSAPRVPLIIPSVSVYARLTDAIGAYTLFLDVVRRDDLLDRQDGAR